MSVHAKIAKAAVKRHRATVALNILLEHAPTWGNLALFVEHLDAPSDDSNERSGGIAWTNGKRIWYGGAFEAFTKAEKVGVTVHELLHCALRHSTRAVELAKTTEGFDPWLWNVATDAIINDTIRRFMKQGAGAHRWIDLPDKAIYLEGVLAQYKAWRKEQGLPALDFPAPSRWSSEQLYRLLIDWKQKQQQSQGEAGDLPFETKEDPTGNDLEPDTGNPEDGADGDPEKRKKRMKQAIRRPLSPDEKRALDEATRQWRERIERAKAGDQPGGILRGIEGDLPEVRTPWELILRTKMAKAVLPQSSVTPERPSRRWLAHTNGGTDLDAASFESAIRYHKPGARVAIGIDTSGSICASLLRRFAAEIQQICRRTKSEMIVIVCDAAVQEVHKIRAGGWDTVTQKLEFKGGGGTDFRPFIEEALKHDPNIIVHLTDLMGTFPERAPRGIPVLWAVPDGFEPGTPPFGKVITLF